MEKQGETVSQESRQAPTEAGIGIGMICWTRHRKLSGNTLKVAEMSAAGICLYLLYTASSVLFLRNGRPAGPWNFPAPSSAPQWLIT